MTDGLSHTFYVLLTIRGAFIGAWFERLFPFFKVFHLVSFIAQLVTFRKRLRPCPHGIKSSLSAALSVIEWLGTETIS